MNEDDILKAVAYIFWPPGAVSWSPGMPSAFVLSGLFATLFVVLASLFLKAGEKK